MHVPSANILKIGGDPRTFAEYIALRDEIARLKHPARPDVNWHAVEKHCLSLFGQNGVERQTVAWYALARTERSGLRRLNQGLALNPLSQLDMLRNLLHNRVDWLAQSQGSAEPDAARPQTLVRPVKTDASTGGSAAEPGRHDSRASRQPNPLPTIRMCAARQTTDDSGLSEIGMATLCRRDVCHAADKPCRGTEVALSSQPDPLRTALKATLASLPVALTPEQQDALQCRPVPPSNLTAQTVQQLARLDQLPPDRSLTNSRQIAEQALRLWPEQAKPLMQRWQQQRNAAASPAEQLAGWHQGMTTLQELGDRLNRLDEQKGNI